MTVTIAFPLCEFDIIGGGRRDLRPVRFHFVVLGALDSRLREFRGQLPDDSETARAIDRGARLEEISEAAQREGLTSLAAMLMEAEQEQARA